MNAAHAQPSMAAAALLVAAFSLGPPVAAPALAADFTVETAMLENGMQVVVVPDHRAPLITQLVYYKVGSADEVLGKSGVAHFLEHMMFQGTNGVPAEEFRNTIALHGGEENAFTSPDITGYWQTVAVQGLEMVMRLESDRMQNLLITDKDFESEREVIKEERRSRYETEPAGQFNEQMQATVFIGHPYGWPTIGWMHEIETLTRQDAVDWYEKWYAPNNAILIIAGDTSLAEVLPLARKYYGVIPASAPIVRDRPQEPPHLAERRLIYYDDRVRQPSFSRVYLASSRTARDGLAPALTLLSDILAGGTGRLYQALVVEREVAVGAGSFYSGGAVDLSQFGVWAAPTSGGDIATVEAAIDAELERLLTEGITAEELALAKSGVLTSLILRRDSVNRVGRRVGSGLAVGLTIDEVVGWSAEIEAVTIDDVNTAAAVVLVRRNSATGLLLPSPEN